MYYVVRALEDDISHSSPVKFDASSLKGILPWLAPNGGADKGDERKPLRERIISAARRKPKPVAAAAIVIAVLLIVPTIYLQTVMTATSIDVVSMKITGAGEDHIDLELELVVDSAAPMDGSHARFRFSLDYNGSYLGYGILAPADIPAGRSLMRTTATFYPQDMGTFDEMNRAMFTQDTVRIRIHGWMFAGASGVLGAVKLPSYMDRTVAMPGIKPMDTVIHTLNVTDVTADSMVIRADVEINNTSPFGIDLSDMGLDVIYDGETIGRLDNQRITILPGNNRLNVSIRALPGKEEGNRKLIQTIMSGHDARVEMKGSPGAKNLLERTLRFMNSPTVMPAVGNITVEQRTMEILGWDNDSFTVRSVLVIDNPTPVGCNVSNVSFGIVMDGRTVGRFNVSRMVFGPGRHVQTIDTELIPASPEMMAPMLNDIIAGRNTSFMLTGLSDARDYLSRVMVGTEMPINITGDGVGTRLSMVNMTLLECTDSRLVFESWGNVENTGPLRGSLGEMTMEAVYKGGVLGTLKADAMAITAGNSTVHSTLTIDLNQQGVLETARSYFADYLGGRVNSISVTGAPGGDDILTRTFEHINITVDLGEPAALNISMGSMETLSYDSSTIDTRANLTIYNPTAFQGDLKELTFRGYYEGKPFGTITSPFNIRPGWNQLSVDTVMRITDVAVLGEFTSDMLNGTDPVIYISGVEDGNAMEKVMSSARIPLHVTDGGKAGIDVLSIRVLNTTKTKATLRVVSRVTNPTGISMDMEALDLALYYNGTNLGEFTSKPRKLVPGVSTWTDDVDIDATDERVEAALSELTGQHLKGKKVTLYMTGASHRTNASVLQRLIDSTMLACTMENTSTTLDLIIDSMELYGTIPDENALRVRTTMTVTNPSIISGDLNDIWMVVYYGERKVGDMYMPVLSLNEGNSTITADTVLYPTAPPVFSDMVKAISDGEEVKVFYEGKKDVNIVSSIMSNVKLSLAIADTEGISVDVDRFTIMENNAHNMTIWVQSTIHNPSVLKADLRLFNVTVYYLGEQIGFLEPDTPYLMPGINVLDGLLTITDKNMDAASELVSGIMSGQGVTIELKGRFRDVLTDYDVLQLYIPLESNGTFSMETKLTKVVDGFPDRLALRIEYSVFNPTPFYGTIPEMNLLGEYVGMDFGVFVPHNMTLRPGWNNITVDTDMLPLDVGAFTDLTTQQLKGRSVKTTVSGYSEATDMFSRLISSWESEVTLESDGPIEVDLTDYRFLSSTDTDMVIQLKGTLTNPSYMEALPLILNGTLYYDNKRLGHIETDKFGMVRGQNVLDITATLSDVNPDMGAEMVATYLHGADMPLRIFGGLSKNGTSFSFLNLEITVPANGKEMSISLDSMKILQTTESDIEAMITVVVDNPTIIWGTFGDLAFDTYYNGTLAGVVFTGDFQVVKGVQSITVQGTVDVIDANAYTEVINSLFSGNDAKIVCTSSNRSSKLLQAFMDQYTYEVYIRSYGDVEIEINSMWIKDGWDDTLVLGVNATLYNPSTVEADLGYLYFDMYYKNADVGDIVFEPMHMKMGFNYATSTAYFSGKSDLIGEILSNYMSGQNTSLLVKGDDASHDDVIGDVLRNWSETIILEGVQDPLILMAVLENIQIDIMGAGFSATVRTVVQNPTEFDFNITAVDADVFMNDNDPSTFMLSTYPPAEHVYVSTMNVTYDPYLYMEPRSMVNITAEIYNNDWEINVRLYDEYMVDHDLTVDIDGNITINVGSFYTTVHFAQDHIPVY